MAIKIDHTILDGENISRIENEKIKLGINLELGGAVIRKFGGTMSCRWRTFIRII